MLLIRILGPLEVAVADETRTISALKERTLLAILASQSERHVRTEQIIDELWTGAPPANAAASVHVLMSRIRRHLGKAGSERLRAVPGGYTLSLGENELDERIFTASLQDGRDSVRLKDHLSAVRALREGLGLWRGDPYADVSSRTTDSESVRLRGMRVSAIDSLFEAELALGHHGEILTELDRAIVDNPFHEHFWGMRMIALYRCGRQAEALRSYRDLRQLTRSELGFDPTPELQRLEQALLEHDPNLAWAGPGLERIGGMLSGPISNRVEVPRELVAIPAQPRLAAATARPLVGRVQELSVLAECRDLTGPRGLRASLVSGEPGGGKTRLVMHEAVRAVHSGAGVIAGRCDEDAVGPYQPVAEIVSWILDSVPRDQLVGALSASTLVHLERLALESTDGHAPSTSDDSSPVELYEAVAALFRMLSSTQDLVLVLEDLHWIDTATSDLLRYVVRRLETAPLVLFCTQRTVEAAKNQAMTDLIHTLRRATEIHEIELDALGDDDVSSLAHGLLGRPISAQAATALQEQTGGNPLFVVELLRHLADAGALALTEGADDAAAIRDAAPPQSLRETVERRIQRLERDTACALGVGSVIGREFDTSLVARITGSPASETARRLRECEEVGLVESVADLPGRYSFSHALIRRTLYDRIPVADRIKVHGEIAAALEADGAGTAAQVAQHYYEASAAGPPGKAIAAACRAALESRRALAYDDAVEIMERIRRLADSRATVRERVETLLALGDAYWWAGQMEQAEKTCAEAIRIIEVEKLEHDELFARAVLGRWRNNGAGTQGFSDSEPDHELIQMIEAALESVADNQPLEASLLGRLGIASYWTVPEERRREIAERAVDLARESGDESVLLDVMVDRQLTLWSPGAEDQRLMRAAEVLALARKLGQTARQADAHTYQFVDNLGLGNVRAADANLRDYLRATTSLRQPFYRWHARLLPALRALMDGRFDEAEALAATAIDEGEQGAEAAELIVGLQTLWTFYEKGRLAEIAPMIELVAGSFGEIPALDAARVWVAAEVGDHETAAATLAEFVEEDFADFAPDIAWLAAMCMLASAAATIGDKRAAAKLRELLRPFSGRNAMVWVGLCLGPVDHMLGRLSATLGDLDEAAEYLDAAAAMTRTMRARPLHLRVKLDRCLVSLAAGSQPPTRIAAYLRSITHEAGSLGMEGVRSRAAEVLSELTGE